MVVEMMQAAVLVEPGRFDIQEVSRPQCGPGDVIIRVARCCICGTDVHIFKGNYSADKLPLIPGHEFSGTIEEVGSEVTSFFIGQKAVADINVGCGSCFYCRRNEILNCPSMSQLGIHMDGAFAEFIRVPARLVIPVPDSMSLDVAALTEPVACVVRSAVKTDLRFSESVVVLGLGPIGNLHVQLARAIGAAPIIAVDLNVNRAELAKSCGADVVVTDPDAVRDAVLEVTDGRGADVVIESVGSPALYEQAFQLVRPGGRIAAFGLTDDAARVPFSPFAVVLKEIGLKGSVAGMGEDMHQAMCLLAHGRLNVLPFLKNVRPLAEIQDGITEFISNPDILKVQISI